MIVFAPQHFAQKIATSSKVNFDPGQFHAADTLILYIRAD
jgi:hypothetical protein